MSRSASDERRLRLEIYGMVGVAVAGGEDSHDSWDEGAGEGSPIGVVVAALDNESDLHNGYLLANTQTKT